MSNSHILDRDFILDLVNRLRRPDVPNIPEDEHGLSVLLHLWGLEKWEIRSLDLSQRHALQYMKEMDLEEVNGSWMLNAVAWGKMKILDLKSFPGLKKINPPLSEIVRTPVSVEEEFVCHREGENNGKT